MASVISKKYILPFVVLAIGSMIAWSVATMRPELAPEIPAYDPPWVEVVNAKAEDITLSVNTQGTVSPRHQIDLVAQVAGVVKEVSATFADGAFFVEGENILTLDARDYEYALIGAESRVADAEQLLATEKALSKQARREWRDLGKKDANDLALRKPQLARAQANLRSAKAVRDQAAFDLERTRFTAPFDGRVRKKHVDVGQYVGPGTVLARLYATDVVEIRLPLTDRQIALVDLPLAYKDNQTKRNGPAVKVSGVFGGKRYQWEGRIVRTDATIDTASRVMYAVAEIEKPFESVAGDRPPLSIGLFVEADIEGRRFDNVYVLPRAALRYSDEVLTVDEHNQLRIKKVKVLKADADKVVLKADWQGDTRVIVSSLSTIVEGMKLKPNVVANIVQAGVVP